jgi:four helix bundle protein
MTIQNFTDLRVWQAAHQLALSIYKLTDRYFPKSELYGLTSQIRRAAVSVPANIAEGFKKRGKPDKARFYNIAQGSLAEVEYYLLLAKDLGYADTVELSASLDGISRMLTRLIQGIK